METLNEVNAYVYLPSDVPPEISCVSSERLLAAQIVLGEFLPALLLITYACLCPFFEYERLLKIMPHCGRASRVAPEIWQDQDHARSLTSCDWE